MLTNKAQERDTDAKAIAFLRGGMDAFYHSGWRNVAAFRLILAALSDAPLYFAIAGEPIASFGHIKSLAIKTGVTSCLQNDVEIKICTLACDDENETVPMFISGKKSAKRLRKPIARYTPSEYIPMLVQMDKQVILEPFSESRLILSQGLIREIILPALQKRACMEKERFNQGKTPTKSFLIHLRTTDVIQLSFIPFIVGRWGEGIDYDIWDNQAISHNHAVFSIDCNGESSVMDLGSKNGTFVNEVRLTPSDPRHLAHGDVVSLANETFLFIRQ